MSPLFHVTSVRNRESIRTYGLDWTRMGPAPGIAGSAAPEVEGCFVCHDEWEVDWFVRMNNTGGPVDVWVISGVDPADLLDDPSGGHAYIAHRVAAENLLLHRQDVQPSESYDERPGQVDGQGGPQGSMSVTFRPGAGPGASTGA